MSGTAVAFVFMVVGAGLRFGFSVALARMLGAEGAGVYFQAISVITVGEVLGRFGLGNALLRFVASTAAAKDWSALKGVYYKGVGLAVGTSLSTAVAVWLMAPWLASVMSEPALLKPLRLMALAILPLVFLVLHGQMLRALKHIAEAQFVTVVGMPLLSLVGLLLLVPSRGVTGAALAYTVAAIIVALLGIGLWQMATPQKRQVRGRFATRQLLDSSLPVWGANLIDVLMDRNSLFFLGLWGSSGDVGVFGAASRTALLTAFVLAAVNIIAAPKFSSLYYQNDFATLDRLTRNITRLAVLLSLPAFLLFVTFPEWIMQIFGQGYVEGTISLTILAAGQLVNVASGSVIYLLLMTGHEKVARNNALLSLVINVVLNVVLIPFYGLVGAALATAVSLAFKNLTAVYLVRKYVGINLLSTFYKR